MKKLLLSVLFLLQASIGFSQFVEDFENTTGITGPLPATWALGSGNWTVFENNTPANIGTGQSWGINAFATGIAFQGVNCASVSREGIGAGNTSEDYLVTPPVTIPADGQLSFYTRTFTSGDQGTVYRIMIAPAFTSPSDAGSYVLIEEWTETNLNSNFSVYEEKTVDLSDYAGIGVDVYIAFVRVHTQPDSNINGDRWLIDNVNLHSNPCDFSASAGYLSPTSVQLNWTSTTTEPIEVMILPCDDPAPSITDSGIITNGNPYIFTNLISGNCYKIYVKTSCLGVTSWTGVNILSALPPIRLIAFIDSNNNGIKDANELYYSDGHFIIETNNSTTFASYFAAINSFIPNLITDVFDFDFSINSSNSCFTLGSFNYDNIEASYQTQTFYFPLVLIPDCFDNLVTLAPLSRPVPGTIDQDPISIISNYSVIPQSITLIYTKAPNISISSVSPTTGIVFTPTGFTHTYSVSTPSTKYLTVRNTIPTIPTVNLGDILTSSVSISSSPTDANPSNNTASISQIVSSSYDPNDITESHGPKIQFDQFSQNDYLTYTIRFQNTGNANAIRVRVDHTLDAKIDENSIEMIASRHGHIMVRRGNTVSWEFNNIQLPPASVNEDLSNGFITFRVKLKPGFAIGNIIPATASIYFDSNPAILTSTFNTEFVQLLGNPTFDTDSVSLYPNPANDIVTITNNNSSEKITKLAIYDITGKKNYTLDKNTLTTISINISPFAKGIYLVELTSDSNSKITKKLILK